MATTSGAPFAASYFNATAKWVGFTTMTSAIDTDRIIWLRLIASARDRIERRISGFPSCCFISSRSSWRVMRSCFMTRRFWYA